jgi:pyrroloquinoline quinone biosynthesis protein D
MTDDDSVPPTSRPKLQSFVRPQYDETRERWVLQAPERVLALDETGKAIIDLCTGEATVAAIIDRLAGEYDAPRDMIEHDVLVVLRLLHDKGFLVLEPPPEAG